MPQSRPRLRALAFDLDGTLVDSAPDLAAAINVMLEALGCQTLSISVIKTLVGRGVEQLVSGALAVSAGAPSMADSTRRSTALAIFTESYRAHLLKQGEVYPGVSEGLAMLAGRGLPLCCVTNKHSQFTQPLLRQTALISSFELVLCADRPEQRKPSPAMLQQVCKDLQIAPAQLLYIGDSCVDVAAARAAGCPIMVVDYGYESQPVLLAAGPDRMISGLIELAAAIAGD